MKHNSFFIIYKGTQLCHTSLKSFPRMRTLVTRSHVITREISKLLLTTLCMEIIYYIGLGNVPQTCNLCGFYIRVICFFFSGF